MEAMVLARESSLLRRRSMMSNIFQIREPVLPSIQEGKDHDAASGEEGNEGSSSGGGSTSSSDSNESGTGSSSSGSGSEWRRRHHWQMMQCQHWDGTLMGLPKEIVEESGFRSRMLIAA